MIKFFVCEGIQRVSQSLFAILLVAGLCLSLSACATTTPSLNRLGTQEGIASYYGNEFQGLRTSSGELFDNAQLTAAHRTFPFGTIVRVTNIRTNAQVDVRINDRGPRKPERIIDLTVRAARVLGIEREGLGHVRVEVLEYGKN
jgi:peptidoglycan lytic transglycosylase